MKTVEIINFSPNGEKNTPNGSIYQKGGFLNECRKNKNSFIVNNNQFLISKEGVITEGVHSEQYGLYDYKGGIIIFSTDVNSLELSESKILNWLYKNIKTLKNRLFAKSKLNKIITKFNSFSNKKIEDRDIDDYIGAFSIGNFFSGRYVGDNDKTFNEKSLSIEINGISTDALIYLAEEIATDFNQETVLVKDLNTSKIFLVNQDKNGDYDLSNINKKS